MVRLLEGHGATPTTLSGVQALQAACLRGDEPQARALVTADLSLIADPRPLLAAGEFGNARAVDLLLRLGGSVGGLDHDGISPLHRTVQSGSLEAVKRLVEAGAGIELRERRGRGTAMSWSVVLGKPHIADYLAPLSRDVRARANQARMERLEAVLRTEPELANRTLSMDESPTPLFGLPDDEAAAVEVARLLIAYGGDPAVHNKAGQTAIDAARARGLEEAAELTAGGVEP